MHSATAATILLLLALTASPTLALTLKQKPLPDNEPSAQDDASQAAALLTPTPMRSLAVPVRSVGNSTRA